MKLSLQLVTGTKFILSKQDLESALTSTVPEALKVILDEGLIFTN